ncbi:MAG: heavy-metal-associated domain-containing protein [Actinomycetes bacterium]
MEEVTIAVPGLWADHHVVTVLGLLRNEPGVASVTASALEKSVRLSYDPETISPEQIAARLNEGGYATGSADADDAPPTDKPAWNTAGVRITTTDPADLAMSGDHRKY